MKPEFCETDHQKLRQIVESALSSPQAKDAMMLARELNRANVVKDNELSPGRIRIGSEVTVKDEKGNTMQIRLVLPSQANMAAKKVSVLAPLAVALLGFNQKDIIDWELPSGKKKLTVMSVLNEPEMQIEK